MIKLLAICLLLIFNHQTSASEIYTWKDNQGETHFGDSAPAQYKNRASLLKSETYRANRKKIQAPVETLQEKLIKLEERTNQNKAAEMAAEKASLAKERRIKSCRLAKENLRKLQERSRIRVKQAKGEYKMLSHEEKQHKEKKLKEQLLEFCKE